ncbi:platelet-activating factor acetylhydrolase, II-domain-containing [Salix suchowensis]|nr:platelet-activating factor acetylhydrolase, II-domain-containing [Salix suchowensis]
MVQDTSAYYGLKIKQVAWYPVQSDISERTISAGTGLAKGPSPTSITTHRAACIPHTEMYIAYKAFAELANSGNDGHSLENVDGSAVKWESWCPGYVNCSSDVTLAGHSFGGCTVLSILSTEPPPGHHQIPVTKALVLDPWLEPLPTPGPSPYSSTNLANAIKSVNLASACASTLHHNSHDGDNRDVTHAMPSVHHQKGEIEQARSHPRILVINSERFTLWKDHFSRLQDVIKEWEPRGESILTIIRAEHQSFSDFPVLPLLRNKTSRMIMQLIAKLSISFLDGSMEHTVETRRPGRWKRKLLGPSPMGVRNTSMDFDGRLAVLDHSFHPSHSRYEHTACKGKVEITLESASEPNGLCVLGWRPLGHAGM